MNKRLSRQEMVQKDEFITGVERALGWLEENWKRVGFILGGVIVAALLVGAGLLWMSAAGAEADRKLSRALALMEAPVESEGDFPTADEQSFATLEERDSAILAALDELLASHSLSRAATIGSYVRGATLLRLQRPDEAREALLEFTSKSQDEDLLPLARRALARAELASGNSDAAMDLLQQLVDAPTVMIPVDAALMELARAQESSGKLLEAAESYRRLVNEHPQSIFSGEAGQAFARLSAAGNVPAA